MTNTQIELTKKIEGLENFLAKVTPANNLEKKAHARKAKELEALKQQLSGTSRIEELAQEASAIMMTVQKHALAKNKRLRNAALDAQSAIFNQAEAEGLKDQVTDRVNELNREKGWNI